MYANTLYQLIVENSALQICELSQCNPLILHMLLGALHKCASASCNNCLQSLSLHTNHDVEKMKLMWEVFLCPFSPLPVFQRN